MLNECVVYGYVAILALALVAFAAIIIRSLVNRRSPR